MINTISYKNNKSLGLSFIMWAFVFCFLPDFALIDIAPDIFAYILIYVGLSKLSFMNDMLDEARNLFFKMIIVGAAKLASVFFVFGTATPKEQVSLMLLMVFVFAVLDAITLIPAYIKLFDGLLYLGIRYDGTAVFGKQKSENAKSATDKVKFLTIAFVIIKNLLLLLPETPALSISNSMNSAMTENIGMIEFIPHMRIFGMIFSLGVGIFWLCYVISYFRSLKKDNAFVENVSNEYCSAILPNEKLFVGRRMKTACLLFSIAAIFALDFYIGGNSGYNMIPDALFAIGCFCGILAIRKYLSKWLLALNGAFCLAYAFIATYNGGIVFDFLQKYSVRKIKRNPEVYGQWINIIILTVVEVIVFLGVVVTLLFALKKIVENHTGYVYEAVKTDSKLKLAQAHAKLNLPLIVTLACSILASAGSILKIYLFSIPSEISASSWLIELGLTLLFVVALFYAVVNINQGVKEKYKYL